MFNVLLQKISSPTSLLSEGLAIAPGFNALLVGPDDCVSIRWRLNHSSRMPRNRRRRICRLSAWSCALVFPFKIPFTNLWSSKPSGASRNCRRFNSRGRQTRGCIGHLLTQAGNHSNKRGRMVRIWGQWSIQLSWAGWRRVDHSPLLCVMSSLTAAWRDVAGVMSQRCQSLVWLRGYKSIRPPRTYVAVESALRADLTGCTWLIKRAAASRWHRR